MTTSLKKRDKKKKQCIFEHGTLPLQGEVVGKICSSRYYVYQDTLVDDVADALLAESGIAVLAVVDCDMNTQGIIVRARLFDLLSKPFGRDLFKNRKIAAISEETDAVKTTKNIFVVAAELDGVTNNTDVRYYTLYDENKKFAGIFSTRNILVYLSELTMKDIALAKKLQNSIVKKSSAYNSERLEVVAGTKMAKGIGGDFYSARKYTENNWVVALCDVSGKGVSASLISVALSGMFSIYDFNHGLVPFITSVNDYICDSFESGKFITGIFADINEKTGAVVIYDMGHSYTYVYGSKRVERIDAADTNVPLGIHHGLEPCRREIVLQKNEVLITLSDGIEEQTNIAGEEYTVARFMNVLIKNIKQDAQSLRKTIFSQIKEFRNGQAVQDDMTYLLVKWKV